MALPESFYLREDVTLIARELLGKVVATRDGSGKVTAGRITETEAYAGFGDKACHAANGKRTQRNATMYRAGGISYVYLCYGLHALFNVVTNAEGRADAVLIRAVEPLQGIEWMMARRGAASVSPGLCAGPARMTQALGITVAHDGLGLADVAGFANVAADRSQRFSITIEDDGWSPEASGGILHGPRIGVAYAGEDAFKPWRYAIGGSRWISRPNGNDSLRPIV